LNRSASEGRLLIENPQFGGLVSALGEVVGDDQAMDLVGMLELLWSSRPIKVIDRLLSLGATSSDY